MRYKAPQDSHLYIVYCGFDPPTDDSDKRRFGSFEFLLSCTSVEEIKEECKLKLAELHSRGGLFDTGCKIWIQEIVELKELPAEGIVLNCKLYTSAYLSLRVPFDNETILNCTGLRSSNSDRISASPC